jgi:hypothetical protein
VRISQRQHADLHPVDGHWEDSDGQQFPDLLAALAWPGLAKSRIRHAAADSPFAPIRNTYTGRAGEIDMRTTKTIIYTADPPGERRPIYQARRDRLTRILTAYGYTDWRFHFGDIGKYHTGGTETDLPSTPAYCSAHCRDHARFCLENDPPLCVMEDDAEPDQPGTHLVPPPDADRLHIGACYHGVALARRIAWHYERGWRHHKGVLWKYAGPEWYREAGSLAYHCVLYLKKPVMRSIAEYVQKRTGAIDASVAELDGRFKVYAPTRCWWWQNDDHNGNCATEAIPPELRIR